MELPHPTPEQLEQINRFTPANMPPLTAEEVVVTYFRATDNLVTRSLAKWSKEDIPVLGHMLLGLPFTLDHDWHAVEKTQGLVFATSIQTRADVPEWALDRAGNKELNLTVAKTEGYIELIAEVAFPLLPNLISSLKFGLLNCVSLGGFVYRDHWCPLCDRSFLDKHCNHYMPDLGWGADPFENTAVAPYYVRKGVLDLGELSAVLIGNIPAAGIVRRHQ